LGAQHRNQAWIFPRLLDEIARPPANGLDRNVDAAPSSHHYDRKIRIVALDLREEVKAFLPGGSVAGVIQVYEGNVEFSRRKFFNDGAGRRNDLSLHAFCFQQ
jgi:hypothetical protein